MAGRAAEQIEMVSGWSSYCRSIAEPAVRGMGSVMHVESLGRLQEGRGVTKWKGTVCGCWRRDHGGTRLCPGWYPQQGMVCQG